MTTAVCFRCGSMKFGAFNSCPECQAAPESEDDYAVSLAITEHYFPKEELAKISAQVSNGEELHIDPEVKWRFIQMLKAEGVGRPPITGRQTVPMDTIRFLDSAVEPAPRHWWRFRRE
jgi:hypothetical protein